MLMETYSYSRRDLGPRRNNGSSHDAYNALLNSPQPLPTEYWTNGTTTHLHIMASTTELPQTPTTTTVVSPPLPERRRSSTTRLAQKIRRSPSHELHRNDANVVRNSLIAGSVSGMSSCFLLYPLEVLRTKLQTSGMTVHAEGPHGPIQMFRHTIQHGGIRALYTGMTLPFLAQAVYKGTVFTTNNVTSTFILNWRTLENHKTGIIQDGRLTMMDRFWCGFVGGAVNALFFVTPVEFVRNQMIAQHSKLAAGQKLTQRKMANSFDVIRYSIRQHGVRSLWRGASLSVARDAWGCGAFFVTMAWMQKQLASSHDPGEKPSLAATVVSGGTAGLAFWVAALPLDTVKTWVQSSDLGVKTVSASETVRHILHRDGPFAMARSLFRGWQVAYGRGIPASAITMTVYSFMYQYMQGGHISGY